MPWPDEQQNELSHYWHTLSQEDLDYSGLVSGLFQFSWVLLSSIKLIDPQKFAKIVWESDHHINASARLWTLILQEDILCCFQVNKR